ncbi:methylated-DNA--[protein]-cysteine S-methyltransferase [Alicyclobacillus dauci]|uniref:Methylated-DNA--protein-cysteine methyltransferase n=1 Tax=Alicyclobacillus dauci TaxID=1475485 RepID=A0ABY6Z0L3_9BACL|nr:methylated-DNA--[protein]-cysteine S-methyltransferase [Alicyclobacillus dauci]WAH36262.1 methylated-DNA--[protein]-cysteine S-methyltransferase [Alicyclobacillus dauci]WAH39416.1 methylated-DNA--[protein]-cysteine S-methyltransferase [Alicyclobacillus dauci]
MNEATKVYWGSLTHNGWTIYAASTTQGLCCVTFPNQTFVDLSGFVSSRFPNANLEQNEHLLAPYMVELEEYLEGHRTYFSIPLDLHGTSFQQSVWNELLNIPHGQTATYSSIATSIGRPSAVRAVGTAIGKNPIAFIVPCHRVVGKDGSLTGYRGGLDVKSALLKLEGMEVSEKGCP